METYSIIDLFAGCGGMSLGFEMAEFRVCAAFEKDEWAAETYAYNRNSTPIHVVDITTIQKPSKFLGIPPYTLDGIVGGPPCQGFSLSGSRDPKDPRNSLFMDYMRFVNDLKPKFFVMENVSGILSAKTSSNELVHKIITATANNCGYNVEILKLHAENYGVPQARYRIFFVGIRKDLPFAPSKLLPPQIPGVISIQEALNDLPPLNAGEGDDISDYVNPPVNNYQIYCRNGALKLYNHVAMKHTPRLLERFKYIKHGQSIADVPDEHKQRQRGNPDKISGKVFSQNYYRPYPNKPSPTIPASFQSNFIHPFADRNYTAREAARLQSFPDHYVFKGNRITMSWEKNLSQYKQIGNAVPPLLAKGIATTLHTYLENIKTIKDENCSVEQVCLF